MNRPILTAAIAIAILFSFPTALFAEARDCIHYDDIYPEPGEWIYSSSDSIDTFYVTVRDDVAYFSRVEEQLEIYIVDVSDPYAPTTLSTLGGFESPREIELYGEYALLADKNQGLHLIDVSDPASPIVHVTVDTPHWATGVTVQGDHAYVADVHSGLQIIDLSDTNAPSIIGAVNTPDQARGVCVGGDYAYIANNLTGMIVVNISNPENPYIAYTLDTLGNGWSITKYEEFILMSCRTGGLYVVDVSAPEAPYVVDVLETSYAIHDADVAGGNVYIADIGYGIRIARISASGELTEMGSVLSDTGANGLSVFGKYVLQTDSGIGYRIAPMQCDYYLVDSQGTGDYPDIQSAINAASPYEEVRLADGIYTGYGNRDVSFYGKAIHLSSISGQADLCIVDAEGMDGDPHRGFAFSSGESQDAIIQDITIMGGYADEGGAIKCENGSSPTIRGCVLRNNYGTSGGAIYYESSSPNVENCTISYNTSPISGAAFLLYSDPTFENSILSHSIEGSAVFGYESHPFLSCTDVVWNEGGDWVGCIADQQNQNGNFSSTPAFCDPNGGDFRLQPGSPCLPEHNECEVLVGALGEGDCAPTGVEGLPGSARVTLEAFPNPFNPHLTIRFSLPGQTEGALVVHDVSGRQMRLLKKGQFTQGVNEVNWNGKDDQGLDAASGVYFVRLVAGESEESKKVVLLR